MDGFEQLYAVYASQLTIQLYAYTGDRSVAEELVQEAFRRALARWRRVSGYDDPVAWVRRVAWNLARTRWRRLRRAADFLRRQRLERVEGPSPDRVALASALSNLPAAQRRALILHYLADLSIAQIAEEEKVAVGTVKTRLHRGRAALAAQMTVRLCNLGGAPAPAGKFTLRWLATVPAAKTLDENSKEPSAMMGEGPWKDCDYDRPEGTPVVDGVAYYVVQCAYPQLPARTSKAFTLYFFTMGDADAGIDRPAVHFAEVGAGGDTSPGNNRATFNIRIR